MVRLKSILKWVFIGLALCFIYAPILFLTVYSFNASDTIEMGWQGFDWSHYKYFFDFDNEPIQVVAQTIMLALVVALTSTILGTIGSIGIYYSRKRVKSALSTMNRIPIINAEVVTAISFALFISFFGLDKNTFIPLIIGQTILCTPFVVLSIIPKLKQMDNNLYEAALAFGAFCKY